jgi:hypothetical protein
LRVRNLIRQWKADVICLQETKLEIISNNIVRSLWGCQFVDWCYAASCGASGGIMLMWDKRLVEKIEVYVGEFVLAYSFRSVADDFSWAFAGVYGPCNDIIIRYFISMQGLMDLPLARWSFTWSNNQDISSWSRLDRFLVSPYWEVKFPGLLQKRFPRLCSDHFPILLYCGGIHWDSRLFKFENMWLKADEFVDSVRLWWSSIKVHGPISQSKML